VTYAKLRAIIVLHSKYSACSVVMILCSTTSYALLPIPRMRYGITVSVTASIFMFSNTEFRVRLDR
jgi:hypothetical protein